MNVRKLTERAIFRGDGFYRPVYSISFSNNMDNGEGETIELLGDAGGANASSGERPTSEGGDATVTQSHDTPAEPAEEDLSKDAVRERRTLARRISMYKRVFPEELSELGAELEGLTSKSPEELAALLEEVQFCVETRRSTAQARGLFIAGLTMGEASGPYVGLKLTGLAQVAASSEEILRTVDEVSLRYEGVVQLDPVARLAMAVGQLVLAVDASNRSRESQPTPAPIEAKASAPAPTGIINREEFLDL